MADQETSPFPPTSPEPADSTPQAAAVPVAAAPSPLTEEIGDIILGIDYFRATQTSGAPDNIHYNRQADQQAELLQRLAVLVEKLVTNGK